MTVPLRVEKAAAGQLPRPRAFPVWLSGFPQMSNCLPEHSALLPRHRHPRPHPGPSHCPPRADSWAQHGSSAPLQVRQLLEAPRTGSLHGRCPPGSSAPCPRQRPQRRTAAAPCAALSGLAAMWRPARRAAGSCACGLTGWSRGRQTRDAVPAMRWPGWSRWAAQAARSDLPSPAETPFIIPAVH